MLKVYITDLSAYNQGFLEGKWVDLSISEEELSNEIKEVLENGAKVCKETNHEECNRFWALCTFSRKTRNNPRTRGDSSPY